MCRMLPDLSVKLLISPKLSYNESFSIAEHIRRVEGHIERFSHLQQKWSKSLWSCDPFWPNTENQISTQSDVGRPVVNHIHEDTQDLEGVKQVLRDVRFISIKTDPEFEWMKETLYHYCLCWAHRFWQRQPHLQTFKVVDLLKPKFVSRLDVWFLTDDHRMTHCLLPDCMAFDTTS